MNEFPRHLRTDIHCDKYLNLLEANNNRQIKVFGYVEGEMIGILMYDCNN